VHDASNVTEDVTADIWLSSGGFRYEVIDANTETKQHGNVAVIIARMARNVGTTGETLRCIMHCNLFLPSVSEVPSRREGEEPRNDVQTHSKWTGHEEAPYLKARVVSRNASNVPSLPTCTRNDRHNHLRAPLQA